MHYDWFILRFCFRVRQSLFLLERKRRSHKRSRKKWKRSDSSDSDSFALMTAYDFDFWFSLDPHKRENQPLRSMRHARSIWCMTSSKRKNSVFVRPHVNEKPAFSKISTLEKKRCVFGDCFHVIRVDSRPNRGKVFVLKQKLICVKGGLKLPKHQWNTRWTFARKHGIFKHEKISVAMATGRMTLKKFISSF